MNCCDFCYVLLHIASSDNTCAITFSCHMFESAYASKTCVHGVEVCEVKAKRL